jgi:hypothetical protein
MHAKNSQASKQKTLALKKLRAEIVKRRHR